MIWKQRRNWARWLDANKDWAATERVSAGYTPHTPESLWLCKDGQPVLACDYLKEVRLP